MLLLLLCLGLLLLLLLLRLLLQLQQLIRRFPLRLRRCCAHDLFHWPLLQLRSKLLFGGGRSHTKPPRPGKLCCCWRWRREC